MHHAIAFTLTRCAPFVHCHSSRVFRRRAGPLLEHCGVVGVRGKTAGMFYIHQFSQALIVSPSIAVFANALLAASNGLRLLAPAVLLVILGNRRARCVSSKAFWYAARCFSDGSTGRRDGFFAAISDIYEAVDRGCIWNQRLGRATQATQALQEMIEKDGCVQQVRD